MMEIAWVLIVPVLLSLAAICKRRWLLHLNAVIHSGLAVYLIHLAIRIAQVKTLATSGGLLYLDSLSAVFMIVIALVSTLTSWYAIVYLAGNWTMAFYPWKSWPNIISGPIC